MTKISIPLRGINTLSLLELIEFKNEQSTPHATSSKYWDSNPNIDTIIDIALEKALVFRRLIGK